MGLRGTMLGNGRGLAMDRRFPLGFQEVAGRYRGQSAWNTELHFKGVRQLRRRKTTLSGRLSKLRTTVAAARVLAEIYQSRNLS